MKLRKVKITGCARNSYWYSAYIGHIFTVDLDDFHADSYPVITDHGSITYHTGEWIDLKDIDINYGLRKERKEKMKKIKVWED